MEKILEELGGKEGRDGRRHRATYQRSYLCRHCRLNPTGDLEGTMHYMIHSSLIRGAGTLRCLYSRSPRGGDVNSLPRSLSAHPAEQSRPQPQEKVLWQKR